MGKIKKNITLTLLVTTLELRELRLFVSICCCLIRFSITDLGAGTNGLALLIHTCKPQKHNVKHKKIL